MFTLLLLTVCFSLAVGSTYAQNVESNGSNPVTFQTELLRAEFIWTKDPSEERSLWKFVDNNSDNGNADNPPVFSNDSWEPGYTEARYFKLKNGGTATFDYSVKIGYNSGDKLAEVIDVYRCELPAERFTNRTALLTSAEYLGTLEDLKNNKDGVLIQKNGLASGAEDGFTIVLSMQQSAGNDYQKQQLEGLTINMAAVLPINENVN